MNEFEKRLVSYNEIERSLPRLGVLKTRTKDNIDKLMSERYDRFYIHRKHIAEAKKEFPANSCISIECDYGKEVEAWLDKWFGDE